MERKATALTGFSGSGEGVALALQRIEASATFAASPRHRALLHHLVTHALAGDLAALKESVIAIELFGRPAARFDPQQDTIVRVEARRLRQRLARYYEAEGRDDPLLISLPVGSYVPAIAPREHGHEGWAATRRARDLAERGEHFLRQALSKQTLEAARERFEAALAESPAHAPAWVGLGRAWLNLATGWYVEPARGAAEAARALRRALGLDAGQAVAHALLGAIEHQFERDWPAAQASFQRALALAPDTAFVHSAYGCHLMLHGAFDESEHELHRARELDPHYINTRKHLVNLRIAQRRYADAEAEIDAMQDIAPSTLPLAGSRALIALLRGDAPAAVALYEEACAASPGHPGAQVALAGALAAAGQPERADALVAAALQRPGGEPLSPYVSAIYATRRGRFDRAFADLGRCLAECDPLAVQVPHDPSFDALHDDARWPPLCTAALQPVPRAPAA